MSTMVKIWTWWTWTSQLKHNSWLSWWGKMLLILPTVTTIARCVLHRDVRGSRRWDHFESQFFQTSFSHGGFPGCDPWFKWFHGWLGEVHAFEVGSVQTTLFLTILNEILRPDKTIINLDLSHLRPHTTRSTDPHSNICNHIGVSLVLLIAMISERQKAQTK